MCLCCVVFRYGSACVSSVQNPYIKLLFDTLKLNFNKGIV